MPKTEMVDGGSLKAGDVVRNQGYRWEVLRVEYDPRGNDGATPRWYVYAKGLDDAPYREGGMEMGLRTDLQWSREVTF